MLFGEREKRMECGTGVIIQSLIVIHILLTVGGALWRLRRKDKKLMARSHPANFRMELDEWGRFQGA